MSGNLEQYLKTSISLLFAKDLKPTDKIVYQYLSWRQGKNANAWPALRTIADDLGLSCSTVQQSIKHLLKHGAISKIPGKRGKGHSNRYTVIVPKFSTIKRDDCTEIQHSIVPETSTNIVPEFGTENKPYKTNHQKKPSDSLSESFKLAELLLLEIRKHNENFIHQEAAGVNEYASLYP